MKSWIAKLVRGRRSSVSVDERILILDSMLEQRLQSRKADRGVRQERSRRAAATKVHAQVARDPLLREQVGF
ncbi:hypothetical protein [Sphingomonas sp. PAMC 26621]|uniref:hypothetical protein n=1 Tax=Sphingomonas sp. PAMC 26621 TaxID=1112213 RepID=UPI0011114247|nr:hypothetical protein [Sphingomonas sp. PAMC 26621]